MNKKGFVRTLEMVLVIALIFGMYSLLYSQVFHVAKGLKVNPTRLTDSILDQTVPYMTKDIDNYNLGGVEAIISSNLVENNIFERTVLKYSTYIAEVSPKGEYVFSYNFPDYTDPNSITVYGDESYDRNVVWSWYRIPMIISSTQTLRDTNIRLELDIPMSIDRETLIFYYNEEEMDMYPEEVIEYEDSTHVKVITRISELKEGDIEAYLYFSEGSYYSKQYKTLFGANVMNITYFDIESAPRADIFFIPATTQVYLSYSMGGEEPNTYNTTITQAAYLNVISSFKKGIVPQKMRTVPRDYTVSERTVWFNDKSCTIRVYAWSI